MSQFTDAIAQFQQEANERLRDTFAVVVRETEQSVKFGSPITGTLGIPVDTGAARNSVVAERLGPFDWQITGTGRGLNEKTSEMEDVGYLRHIEENVRGVTFHSGGPHFFSSTVTEFDKIVDAAVREVAQ